MLVHHPRHTRLIQVNYLFMHIVLTSLWDYSDLYRLKMGPKDKAMQKLTAWSFRSTKLSFSHCGCYTADGCQPFKWSLTNSDRLERDWRHERTSAAVSTLKRTAAICSDGSAVGNKPPTDSISLFRQWDTCFGFFCSSSHKVLDMLSVNLSLLIKVHLMWFFSHSGLL